MKVHSVKIISMDMVFINGLMVENIKVIGRIIKWTDMVHLLGQMVENMKEIMLRIKSTDMESSNGQIRESIKETGLMENNMEKDHILMLKDKRKRVNGLRVKESDGSMNQALLEDQLL